MSGKLLLVSDIEGCQEMSASKVVQSRLMCDPVFFEALKSHLAANPANKVAFLGDYFDLGNKVVDSINGIMDVYKTDPARVTIIIGNRDANKFRLVYEMKEGAPPAVGNLQWGAWQNFVTSPPGFYPDIPTKVGLKDRLTCILQKSMGAGTAAKMSPELDEIQSGYLLIKIFSETNAAAYAKEAGMKPLKNNKGRNMGVNTKFNEFVNNARNLYRAAKIVHYDSDYKTLMSHAGGMDTFFFHEPTFYDPIRTEAVAQAAYYDKIEKARLMLMIEKDAAFPSIPDFNEETYNQPLQTVVTELLGTTMNGALPSPPAEPSGDYCLLQALGLKPDGSKHFLSYIQSCDSTGCKGPTSGDSGDMYNVEKYTAFQDKLLENGVKVLASGHVPHCAPVPLVYKRSDGGKLLFALNDTSNGYRPADRIKGIDSYPLVYVKAGGEAVGVGMLPALEPVSMAGDAFGPMFGEWTVETAPTFDLASKTVVYTPGGALTFPAQPEVKPPGIFKPAEFKLSQGGGRRMRKSRKAKKSRKASRKGRKTRKSM